MNLKKLISIGSSPLGDPYLMKRELPLNRSSTLHKELFEILSIKNGFYAFESALLFRPVLSSHGVLSIDAWNKSSLWRNTYQIPLKEMLFFAEDLFGGQFAICEDEIVSFDPETGEIETIADTFEGFAKEIMSDYDYFTGYSLAAAWQKSNGVIEPGVRLMPKQLFVLGGDFESSNLYKINDIKGMKSRGFFATKLAEVPEGGQVSFELID
tara:strand:- start:133 stop:765 length:633 start_codon:yes stop_codon:yes gene_type:complete